MNIRLLNYLVCPECSNTSLHLEIFSSEAETVNEGRIICRSCKSWYRIENRIVDFLPKKLRREGKLKAFSKKYNLSYENTTTCREEQKNNQIRFFADGVQDYEKRVTNSPYFAALDDIYVSELIRKNIINEKIILDAGCGTGRQLLPLAEKGARVIGIDISEEMLLLAQEKINDIGLNNLVDLIICDVELTPFRNNTFDGCVMVGTLHHIPNPFLAISSIVKRIRIGGWFFSYDPHKSPLRFIFEWSMRVCKLYNEEASDDPLFTEEQMIYMLNKAGIVSCSRLSTYLLPHLFYLSTHKTNVSLLNITDNILNNIPIFRKLGGMLLINGIRKN